MDGCNNDDNVGGYHVLLVAIQGESMDFSRAFIIDQT